MAGASALAIVATAAVGAPDSNKVFDPAELSQRCETSVSKTTRAVWLDGAWWCGGAVGGLWNLRRLELTSTCDDLTFAVIDEQGVACDS
jgi:hypothetical protein